MPRWLFGTLLLGPPVAALFSAWFVYARFAWELPPPLPHDARVDVIRVMRRAVEDGVAPGAPRHPALARTLPHGGPVVASVWLDGERVARVQTSGDTIASAVAHAAEGLAALARADRRLVDGRIQVDVVVARGRVPDGPSLRMFALVPGLDGFGARVGDADILLGAEELIDHGLFQAARPIPTVEDVSLGFAFDRAEGLLARRAALPPGGWGRARREWFRFRADSFVESPSGPLPLRYGTTPAPAPTRQRLLDGAVAGGTYLARHLDGDGRFRYEVDLATGRDTHAPYSLPRHAGTTYFLAEIHAETRDRELRAALDRALDYLVALAREGGCQGAFPSGARYACVVDRGHPQAYLGSTALAAVALAEYRLTTGDARHDELLRAMLEWILEMQRPDGSFVHVWDWRTGARSPEQLLFFDGEAALALARGARVFPDDPRLVPATEKALDYLVGWYDFFAGKFFVGEEHWTCIAAEAAWPALRHDRYREFCVDYAAFLRRIQFEPGEIDGWDGAYGFTPFMIPLNTPIGSRSETMISAYQLTVHHGKPDERIRRQVLAALGYLLGQQVHRDNDFRVRDPDGSGAVPSSAVDRTVRIDFVQHACSAMLRGVPLAE